jgi:hypothetical protein
MAVLLQSARQLLAPRGTGMTMTLTYSPMALWSAASSKLTLRRLGNHRCGRLALAASRRPHARARLRREASGAMAAFAKSWRRE